MHTYACKSYITFTYTHIIRIYTFRLYIDTSSVFIHCISQQIVLLRGSWGTFLRPLHHEAQFDGHHKGGQPQSARENQSASGSPGISLQANKCDTYDI